MKLFVLLVGALLLLAHKLGLYDQVIEEVLMQLDQKYSDAVDVSSFVHEPAPTWRQFFSQKENRARLLKILTEARRSASSQIRRGDLAIN